MSHEFIALYETNLGVTQRKSHYIASPHALDPLPEGEISTGGVRKKFGVPGTATPDDVDSGGGQGLFDGKGFRQPRTDERTIGDDGLQLVLPGPIDQRGCEVGGFVRRDFDAEGTEYRVRPYPDLWCN